MEQQSFHNWPQGLRFAFVAAAGVRQGCPSSSFILVFVADCIHRAPLSLLESSDLLLACANDLAILSPWTGAGSLIFGRATSGNELLIQTDVWRAVETEVPFAANQQGNKESHRIVTMGAIAQGEVW